MSTGRDPRNVDPAQVAEWLAHGQALIAGHTDECECPWCLGADFDQVVAARGLDPSRYWANLPTLTGSRSAPWWETKLPTGTRVLHRAPAVVVLETPEQPEPSSDAGSWGGDPVVLGKLERPAAGRIRDVSRAVVDYIGPGVWIRITGADRAGETVTVSGPVVAGPDEIDGGTAVTVRDYHAGCDRTVRTAAGALVDLVDEDDDEPGRAAWALAPVFGHGARRVHLVRRRTRRDKVRRDTDPWFPEVHEDVSAGQLAEWEQGNRDVRLTAVHHGHIPVLEVSR